MCDHLKRKGKRKRIITFTCYGFCNSILILKYENDNMFDLQPLTKWDNFLSHPTSKIISGARNSHNRAILP